MTQVESICNASKQLKSLTGKQCATEQITWFWSQGDLGLELNPVTYLERVIHPLVCFPDCKMGNIIAMERSYSMYVYLERNNWSVNGSF
jgi:hypothetical protein